MSRNLSPPGPRQASPPVRSQARIRYRRAFWVSIGISAVLHLIVVLLYPRLLLRVPAGIVQPGGSSTVTVLQGTELVNLTELSSPEMEALPTEEPEEETPTPVEAAPGRGQPTTPSPETAGEAGEGRLRTNAEILRPGSGDLRLYAPVDPSVLELSREDLMELELAWALEAMSDSARAAAEAAGRATDWTYTDDEGRRWGVSPGKIHLGGLTLPLPFGFGPPPESREGIQDRVWEWEQIERGAGSASMRQFWRDRAEAMRRRMEAERKPDTTRIRR